MSQRGNYIAMISSSMLSDTFVIRYVIALSSQRSGQRYLEAMHSNAEAISAGGTNHHLHHSSAQCDSLQYDRSPLRRCRWELRLYRQHAQPGAVSKQSWATLPDTLQSCRFP